MKSYGGAEIEISLKFHFWPEFGKYDLKFGIPTKSYVGVRKFRPKPIDFWSFSAIFNFREGAGEMKFLWGVGGFSAGNEIFMSHGSSHDGQGDEG